MLTKQSANELNTLLGPLQRQLESPSRYVRRCVETVSFVETGHEEWSRQLQIQIPEWDQSSLPKPNTQIVSVGLFDRIRFPNIRILEDGSKPVTLLTRDEHAYVMARIWSKKFAIDGAQGKQWSDDTRRTAKRFTQGLNAYFYESQPSELSHRMRIELEQCVARLVADGFFKRELVLSAQDGGIAEETLTVFKRQIRELTTSTQILCWLPFDSKKPFRSLTVEYSKSDRVNPAKPDGGSLNNSWFKELDPVAPVIVKYRPHMVKHCQSYYFQLKSAQGSRPLVAGWEAPEHERTQWMRGTAGLFAASVYLAHNDYTRSNYELIDEFVESGNQPPDPVNPDALVMQDDPDAGWLIWHRMLRVFDWWMPGLRGSAKTLPGLRQPTGATDEELSDGHHAIRIAIGATNEFFPTLCFAALVALFYFVVRGAVMASNGASGQIESDGLGMTALLVFGAVQLLAYVQFVRERRVAHGSYAYTTAIWIVGAAMLVLALFAASNAPLALFSDLADRLVGVPISLNTQHDLMQAAVCLGVACAVTVIVYTGMTASPLIARRRLQAALVRSRLLPENYCRSVPKQCLTHMAVIAPPVANAQPYLDFYSLLGRRSKRAKIAAACIGLLVGLSCLLAAVT